jgi:hypothetical protein
MCRRLKIDVFFEDMVGVVRRLRCLISCDYDTEILLQKKPAAGGRRGLDADY